MTHVSRTIRLRRAARHALAAVAAVTTLSLAPGVAHADTWTHTDPAGDVVKYDAEGAQTASPETERGDVRRVRLTHSNTRLRVRFTMRKAFGGEHGLVYAIRTPRNDFFLIRVRLDGFRENALIKEGGSERKVRCPGIDWAIDRARATVVVSIPRSCLGRPRWVRVGVGVHSVIDEAAFVDDGLRDGARPALRLSPRIHRG